MLTNEMIEHGRDVLDKHYGNFFPIEKARALFGAIKKRMDDDDLMDCIDRHIVDVRERHDGRPVGSYPPTAAELMAHLDQRRVEEKRSREHEKQQAVLEAPVHPQASAFASKCMRYLKLAWAKGPAEELYNLMAEIEEGAEALPNRYHCPECRDTGKVVAYWESTDRRRPPHFYSQREYLDNPRFIPGDENPQHPTWYRTLLPCDCTASHDRRDARHQGEDY